MKFAILLFTLLISLNAQTTWQYSGLSGTIWRMTLDNSGNPICLKNFKEIYKFNYMTDNWDSVGTVGGDKFNGWSLIAIDDQLFVSGSEVDGSTIYRSTDHGFSWISSDIGINSNYVFTLHEGKDGLLYAGADNGLYRSTNQGLNWDKINLEPDSIEVDMIATTSNGYIFIGNEYGAIYRSTDGGVMFSQIDSGITVNIFNYYLITTANDELLLPSVCYIYKSTDYGNFWYDTAQQDSLSECFTYSSLYNKNGILIAGTGEHAGVIISYNNGESWTTLSDGLSSKPDVRSILLDNNGYIHVGTYSDGSYRTTSPITSIEEEPKEVINEFYLSQNYPNPFNPTTTIKFAIADVGNAYYAFSTRLIVYDILGREIKTLLNKKLSPGNYEVTFDGADLPSGVYLYKLKSGDFQATRKMLLVK